MTQIDLTPRLKVNYEDGIPVPGDVVVCGYEACGAWLADYLRDMHSFSTRADVKPRGDGTTIVFCPRCGRKNLLNLAELAATWDAYSRRAAQRQAERLVSRAMQELANRSSSASSIGRSRHSRALPTGR